MKILKLFLFEVQYHVRRVTTWLFFFALLAMLLMVMDEIADYAMTIGGVLLNAPFTIAEITGYANKFGLLLASAIAGKSALRDLQARMDPLIYTKPINKYLYLTAKFIAAFIIITFMLLVATHLVMASGSYFAKADQSLFGTDSIAAYFYPFLIFTLPNSFIVTAILFSIVLFTRNSMAAFMGGVLLFLISSLSMNFGWEIGKLSDPFGINILNSIRLSINPSESNTAMLPFIPFLLNRIIWIFISLILLVCSFKHFKFSHFHRKKNWFRSFKSPIKKEEGQVYTELKKRSAVTSHNETGFYQIFYLGWYLFKEMFRRWFIILLPALLIFYMMFIILLNRGPLKYPVLPTTERISHLFAHPAIDMMMVLFISLFAGHLIWRERDARMNEMNDTVPVKNHIFLISKFLALVLFIFSFLLVQVSSGILVQLLSQHYELQLDYYLANFFIYHITPFVLFGTLALAIHVIVNQKYLSFLVIILLYIYSVIPEKFGIEHKLLQFNSDPDFIQSVLYGRKVHFPYWLVYKIYWSGWVLLFLTLAFIMWVRGREKSFLSMKERYQRLHQMPFIILFPVLLVLLPGGVIFYNTNIRSDYLTVKDNILKKVRYEQLYSKFKNADQPHLTGIELVAELYPEDMMAILKVTYTLKNNYLSEIDSVHLITASGLTTGNIRFNDQARMVLEDKDLNYYIFLLEKPLKAGDSIQMNFDLEYKGSGFFNGEFISTVTENGTWIKSWEWFPRIGYQEDYELVDKSLRKKYELSGKSIYQDLYNKKAVWSRNGNEKVQFTITIGTNNMEIPVTTGEHVKSWTEDGRYYYKYASEKHVLNMFYINSAEYSIRKSTWNDVELLIYHHPRHILNLDKFEQAMKMSLEFYSQNFSPYQFKVLKFVETPDPGTGGISLPGYIGYSSNFSLLHPAKEDRGFDLPFAVAAHEVAHQWWPHQLIPAHVEGSAFLTEGLAWYSAFGVIEKQYGPQHLANLLNAMRKDFLNPRSKADRPLLKAVDKFHGYRKGPFAMYALREYAGVEPLNQALRNLLKEFGSGEPPYVTMLDFYDQLETAIPDSLHYLLHDLFRENTYWDLAIESAEVEKLNNDVWELNLNVHAKKVYVDTEGVETEAAMNDWIEIGVFNNGSNMIYLKKHKLNSGMNHLKFKLNEKPEKAGVDPRYLLIDAEPVNNIKPVYKQRAEGTEHSPLPFAYTVSIFSPIIMIEGVSGLLFCIKSFTSSSVVW